MQWIVVMCRRSGDHLFACEYSIQGVIAMCAVVKHRLQSFGALRLVAAVGVLLLAPGMASAFPVVYGFKNITNNDPESAAIGEAQIIMEVSQYAAATVNDPEQVLFLFKNLGPEASSISEIYFDDGTLLGISQVINGTGVAFTSGSADPGDLPGGDSITPVFNVSAGFLAEASNPAPANGVQPGEQVGIVFNLINGKTTNDVIAALALGLTDGGNSDALRVGMHVIGFANDESESFINGPVVPEPSTFAIAGLSGLAILGYGLRRRKLARA